MSKQEAEKTVTAGVDEAGRGALAGPVVAGACILPERITIPSFIQDSKQLTESEREEAYRWITTYCIHGYGIVEANEIDAERILSATEKAMQLAVEKIAKIVRPTYLLVDGCDKFWFDYPHSSIVRGDALEPCISAASIVAKVTRDRIMVDYDEKFAYYGFANHKGYGTPEHLDLIRTRGPCLLHRTTFLSKIDITPPEEPVKKRSSQAATKV